MTDHSLRSAAVRIAAGLPQGDETRRQILAALKSGQGYVIGPRGLEKPEEGIFLQPDTIYYIGASSSPSEIIVTKVTDDVVEYLNVGYDGKATKQRTERWIAADLITKGSRTWLKSYGRRHPELAKSLQSMLAGKPGKKINVNKYLHDLARVSVTVSATQDPSKYPRGDAWYGAEEYGNVGGITQDDGSTWYVIDTNQGQLDRLKKDPRFEVQQIKAASSHQAALAVPTLSMDYSVLKKEAAKFAAVLGKQIQKVIRGAKVAIVKAEVSSTRGWDGSYYVVLTVTPPNGTPFNMAVTFHSADNGEMSGNAAFDGGGVIPSRTFDKTPEQWIQRLISESESMLAARA